MTTRIGPLVAGLAAALAAAPALAAYDAFVTISAATPAGAPLQAHRQAGGSPFLEFALAAQSPRDLASGQASGKRQHEPVKIVKEWGAVSPDLGSGEINCSAIMIAATLPGGQRVGARAVTPVRAGECRYAIGLPSSTPVRLSLQAGAPGVSGPWTFQAAPTVAQLRPGQTLAARLAVQAFGDGGRFSVEWGAASPQLMTANVRPRIPAPSVVKH